ncbi:WAS/WASL-interacting protein family member 1-like [Pseudopipra pipra]|uniref:WAS/WASL-interacting protein family member 1-like n=1 Tax=Pseudopipra pipra TaxID=415032 RepID=UPI0031392108
MTDLEYHNALTKMVNVDYTERELPETETKEVLELMSLPDDENYPRTTTTSAQSFLPFATYSPVPRVTANPLCSRQCWAAGLGGPARCWRGQGGEGETRRGDYLSKSASESNENPSEGERNPPPSLLRGAAAAAGPPPPPRSKRRRGDNITTIIRAGRGAGSSSVSSSVQRTCRAGGCAAEANPFPPSLLHNINTGRAAPNRFRAALRAGGSGGWPGGSAAKGPPPPPLPPRVRAQESGEGRPGHEQNADRKCSGRNDSLHRRQTPAASPFPSLPSAASSLPDRSLAPPAPLPPPQLEWLPRLARRSLRCVALLPLPTPPAAARVSLSFFFFSLLPPPPPPPPVLRGTRPKFKLKPALRGFVKKGPSEKTHTFW